MGLLILSCVYAVFLFTLLVLCKVYAVLTLGRCRSKTKLHGKTALVTGSNRGIGYFTALDLAKRGARVILTSEDEEDCQRAKDRLIHETGNRNIVAKYLDLRSLDTVRHFANDILNTEDRLDILVNNAGTSGLGKKKTKDGLLPGMQVNYLGPFLLTNLLLGLLKRSGSARIVNVASVLSQTSIGFDPQDINSYKFPFLYELVVYSNSKLCVVHATKEMAKRLKGTGVTVNCLHPGAVYTKIFNESNIGIAIFLKNLIGPMYYKTPEEGAQTSIHLAVCESVEGVTGKYFSDCKQQWIWANLSEKIQKKVWDQSVELVHLSPKEMHFNDCNKNIIKK